MSRHSALLGLFLLAVTAGAPSGAGSQTASGAQRKRLVVVDAGHGGYDPGMQARLPNGSTIDEKVIALGISVKLAAVLRARGVDVVMTRDRDVLVELGERERIANKRHGDIFLSIHVNAAGPGEKNPRAVRGLETYFLAEAKTEDERRVEAMENAVVRFETAGTVPPNDPLAFIISDMAQNEQLRESSELASIIQRGVSANHPGASRGVKQANFSVLRNAYMPAVLVETGYGSNAKEALWLSSEAGQRELAASIADATMEYLEKYERRVRAGGQR